MTRPSLALFVLASLASASYSQTQTDASCPCTLKGTVVNSATGASVRGAFVRISAQGVATTFSDAEGRFEFVNLPAGSYSLFAAKSGFLELEGKVLPMPLTVQLGPATPPAEIKITPEGIIYGHVEDNFANPIEGASADLIYRDPSSGTLFLNRKSGVQTDDQGNFRIAGLASGSYYMRIAKERNIPSQLQDEQSPVAYVPEFYPGVSDLASAAPIQLRPGRSVQTTFTLKLEPMLRLSGILTGLPSGSAPSVGFEFPASLGLGDAVTVNPATGAFQSRWVPPGEYTITAQASVPSADGDSPTLLVARQSVHASTSVSGIRLHLQPTVNIPIFVRGLLANQDSSGQNPRFQAQPAQVAVTIRSRDSVNQGAERTSTPRVRNGKYDVNQLELPGIAPGVYEVRASVFGDSSHFLESLTSGSTDLLHDDLVVESSGSAAPIEATFREGAANITGHVAVNGFPGAYVFLFAANSRLAPEFIYVANDGNFSKNNLAPGDYRIVAVSPLSNIDVRNRDSLQKLFSSAQQISLVPGQTLSMQLQILQGGE